MASPACTACGTPYRPEARFCDHCGAALHATTAPPRQYTPRHLADKILKQRAALQGERKLITVMFADLRDSTALAGKAGPERWHQILDGLFAILTTAVHRYEGTVNQYTGDGIMALFGAPIAHEDHADRACLAAGDIRSAMHSYAEDTRVRFGVDLGLRIGLNSGDVVVGTIGDDLRMDYTAQGLTVNLAQRMEALCGPGQAVLTAATAAQLRGRHPLTPLGPRAIKGIQQLVEAYALDAAVVATEIERPLAGTSFVGRDDELAQLRAAVAAASGGSGRVVLLAGHAGVGKSRLCRELLGRLPAGARGLRAWCSPYAAAYPLAPVRRLLGAALGLDGLPRELARERAAAALERAEPGLDPALRDLCLDLLGLRDEPLAAAGPGLRARMLAFAARIVLGAGQPQLVLIEDLHWADAGTEEFIAQLAEGVPASRTVLLLNTRPIEPPAWLAAGTLDIRLDELAGVDLARFLSSLLGDNDALHETRQRLLAQTRGNPFFIQEAVRHLAENGFLAGAPGAYRPGHAGDAWQIPDSVHALIAARLDRLPDASKRVLQAAAVAGLRFERVQLSWLVESPEDAIDPLLQALERGGFLEARASSWRFAHPLIQEVAYRTQLESHRREAHRRLATELDRRHPPEGAPHRSWITAAHHWTDAAEWERAGTAHLRVARWLAGADPAGAAAAFRRAAAALDQAADSSEVLRDRIAARSGILLQLQLQPLPVAEVERIFKEAQQLALKTRNLAALGELFIAYTIALLQRGDAAAARRLMTDVVNQAIATGAGASVSRFRMTVLLVCTWAGFPREGLALVDKATGEGWRTGPVTEDNFVSRGFLGFMQCWFGELDPARANLLASAAHGAAEDGTAWLDAFHADHAWLSGETAGVLEKARASARRAKSYGAPLIVTIALRGLALALVLDGEAEQAIGLLKSQLPVVAPGGAAHHCEAILLATLATAYARSGRETEAAETAERALASAQRQKALLWEALAWLALLDLRSLAPGRAQEGLARVEALLNEIGAEGLRPWWWLARERWSRDSEQAHCREQALAAFERIGATGHISRLREPRTAA